MRPHARLRLAVAVPLIALITASGLVIGIPAAGIGARPAGAAAAPVPDSTEPDTAEAYRALAIQVSRNNAMLVQLTAQYDATTLRLAEIAAAITDTEQKLDATRAEIARLQQLVRDRAAYIYRTANKPQVAVGDIEHLEDVSSGQKYAQAAGVPGIAPHDLRSRPSTIGSTTRGSRSPRSPRGSRRCSTRPGRFP